jgi:hypothetical protein
VEDTVNGAVPVACERVNLVALRAPVIDVVPVPDGVRVMF